VNLTRESKKVLVTGGGGFIGSHVARYLYSQGNFVRIVDSKFDDYIKEKYYSEKLQLDLRVWENCLVATKGIDKVYNLAANMGGIGFITSVGAEVMHDNVLINTYMLEAARQNKVKRFLFSSSACIYPTYKQTRPDVKGLREEDAYPADPDNFYGWEKLFTEKLCEAYQRDYKMNLRVLRYHNIYGPGENGRKYVENNLSIEAIGLKMKQLLETTAQKCSFSERENHHTLQSA
jgi:nucleoside-diphosphate-sugar epimerase